MEAALRKSVHGGVVKEEMRAESSGDEGCKQEILHKEPTMCKIEKTSADADLRASSSARKEQDHDPLESAKAEMGEVIQENQRLKMHLDRIMKDYRSLQMQFQDIQQEAKKSTSTVETKHESEEHDFVSLSLGRTSSDTKKVENRKICSKEKVDEEDKESLALGLDCNFEMHSKEPVESSTNLSHENSIHEEVKDEAGETWPPQKMLKTARSGEDDISQQNPAKKARVSVRVRCDTPTIIDGCQWRKYGQKIAKGNPCPRAYYRCTIAPNCPVRKQVQRCAEDMSILITTYEGTHDHPLPVAATAMASTTSAAASMLLSGSSSSSGSVPRSQSANAAISTTPTNINGLNFYLSDNSKSKPFYLPNSSISSSSHSSYPTITLDLTSSSSSSLSRISPRYSSTNLNFSSMESNTLPISWSNGVLSYGASSYNKNQMNSLSFGTQPQPPQDNHLFQSYLQKEMIVNSSQTSSLPPDTIAAATKAITSDPSFQSALAAALSSIIGSANGNATLSGNQILADNKPSGQSLKLAEPPFPVLSSFPSTSNANKCASSFLNKSPSSTNSQPFSLQPSLPFSTSKSKSSSPGDSRDQVL